MTLEPRPKRVWKRLREKSPQPPVDSDSEELPFPDWDPLPDFRPKFPEEPRPEELQITTSSKPDEEPRAKTEEPPKIEETPRPSSSSGSGLISGEQRPPQSDVKQQPKSAEEPRQSTSSASTLPPGEKPRPPKSDEKRSLPNFPRWRKKPLPTPIGSRPKSPRRPKVLPKPLPKAPSRPKSDQPPPLPMVPPRKKALPTPIAKGPPKSKTPREEPPPKSKRVGWRPKRIRGSVAACLPPPPVIMPRRQSGAFKAFREAECIVYATAARKYPTISAIIGRGRAKAGLTAEEMTPR